MCDCDAMVTLADRVLELSKQLVIVTQRLRIVEDKLVRMTEIPSMDCEAFRPPQVFDVVDEDEDFVNPDLFG